MKDGKIEQDIQTGTVVKYFARAGYGYIRQDNADPSTPHIIVHRRSLADQNIELRVGIRVSYRITEVPRGKLATDVRIAITRPKQENSLQPSQKSIEHTLLADATLARNNKEWTLAVDLFELALEQAPSIQAVLSYAAMQKSRNRKDLAIKIYERGIKLFPNNAKLREDAGVLAASSGKHRMATRLLLEALELCRKGETAGEKGVLLALARTYYRKGSYKEALVWFTEARKISKKTKTSLAQNDIRAMALAQVHSQHHRGSLTIAFLTKLRCNIASVALLRKKTEGANLVVFTEVPEIIESYGLTGRFLVRVSFKSAVSQSDLNEIDRDVNNLLTIGQIDESIAILVISSLDERLQRVLSRRIEKKTRSKPTIVPIAQQDIETGENAFRDALNRWLYRRDLFATNAPVVGRRFFGRSKPLLQLHEAIMEGTSSGVFGLRKVGKTSLLKETARRAHEYGDIAVFTDLLRLPSNASCRWLYWKIANEMVLAAESIGFQSNKWHLGGRFENYLDLPSDYPVSVAFDSDLCAILKRFASLNLSPKPRLIFLLDEIERLLPNSNGDDGLSGFFEFLSYIRGMNQENPHFVVVVAGANTAVVETPQFKSRDNPVFNYFNEIFLQLLEFRELRIMLRDLGRGMGLKFSREAIEEIHKQAGGHPFFTRQFCSFISEQLRTRPAMIGISEVKSAVGPYMQRADRDFTEIMQRLKRDFPDELDTCIKIAEADGSLALRSLRHGDSTSIRHLLGYQVVKIEGGRVRFTMALMLKWLKEGYIDGGFAR